MKCFILILINILTVSAYTITEIPMIWELVQQIEFDYNQNTFIVASDSPNDVIYKLDSNNEQIAAITLYPYVWKILINKQNDVFIFCIDNPADITSSLTSVYRWKPDGYLPIFQFKYYYNGSYNDPSYFIDSDDNIFFNTESGVAILKTNQDTPIAITNLREFKFNLHAEDKDGNVYLANNQFLADSFAVVYKESKQALIPNGVYIANGVRYTNGLISWNNGTVFSGYISDNVSTVIYSENRLTGLIAQQYFNHTILSGSSNRLFWIGQNVAAGNNAYLYYYDWDNNEVFKVDDSLNATADLWSDFSDQFAIDSSGNIYLASYETEGQLESRIFLLKSNEKIFRRIVISLGRYVSSMAMDKDDNLWVLTDELYLILKDVEYAIKISEELRASIDGKIKYKESTNELFIAAGGAFYVCTYD